MADETMDLLHEEELTGISGGAAGGAAWQEGDVLCYKIEQFDTLSEIAARFGTSVAELQRLNPLVLRNEFVMPTGAVIRIRHDKRMS